MEMSGASKSQVSQLCEEIDERVAVARRCGAGREVNAYAFVENAVIRPAILALTQIPCRFDKIFRQTPICGSLAKGAGSFGRKDVG
jgi:hypothetical protein